MKTVEKKFRLMVRIKDCDTVFDEELGPGVIGSKDLTFSVKEKDIIKGKLPPMVIKTLIEEEEAFVVDLLETKIMELKE